MSRRGRSRNPSDQVRENFGNSESKVSPLPVRDQTIRTDSTIR